jgi:hypothetical protein
VAHAEALRRLRAEDAEGAARLLDEVLGGQRLLRSSLMAACITLRARAVRLSRSQQRPAVDWRCAVQQALHWGRRHPAYLCQALREEAWWCSAQGNLDRARQRLEEALEAARQRQQRHQEALTLEAWGQIGLLAGWEEGPRLLHQGQAMLERQRAPLRRHPLQLQPPAWARAQP